MKKIKSKIGFLCLLGLIITTSVDAQNSKLTPQEKLANFNQKKLTQKLTVELTQKWNKILTKELTKEMNVKNSDNLIALWNDRLSQSLSSKIEGKITNQLSDKWTEILTNKLPDYSEFYQQ